MWQAGLARGGSLDNSVVLDGQTVLNPEGLRWPDEFVRHKVVDLLGDLALLGLRIEGHGLHHALARKLLARRDAWRVVGGTRSFPAPLASVSDRGLAG